MRFFESGDLSIPEAAGAHWLVLDRRRYDLSLSLRQEYADDRYTLYRIP